MLGYLTAVIICSAKRKENCQLQGTDYVYGKIYEYISFKYLSQHKIIFPRLSWE